MSQRLYYLGNVIFYDDEVIDSDTITAKILAAKYNAAKKPKEGSVVLVVQRKEHEYDISYMYNYKNGKWEIVENSSVTKTLY